MPSDTVGGAFSFLMCCFPLGSAKSSSPTHRSDRYNTHLRSNPNLPTERPNQRPLLLASHAKPHSSGQEPESNSSPPMPLNDGPKPAAGPPPSRAKPQKRFPTSTNAAEARWSTANLEPAQLGELFDALHATLGHVPYAVCGLGAMIDHGLARPANRISVLCPAHSKDNVKAWARARGYEAIGADSIGIPTPSDGRVRRVRVKYVDAACFERLERVHARSGGGAAWVLGLSSQLDHVAAGWLDVQRRTGDARALRSIARDVFWALDRAARTRHTLEPRFLPTFLGAEFWGAFTAANEGMRPEAARAGIDVAAVLACHRRDAAIREHNQMLESYGMFGDPVASAQPGPLEDMRCLAEKKSVYSLNNRDSQLLGSDEPQRPVLRRNSSSTKEKKMMGKFMPKKSDSVRSSGSKVRTETKRALARSKSDRPKISRPIPIRTERS
ncbi:hypothetical protein F4779DRAFT_634614 [Xylariaceae sp. FL0662B]|nr:hypothetical protein F4779DRAFT_634614 [Xylariaceae sp. FL0662B]